MKARNQILLMLVAILGMSSCEKDEVLYPRPNVPVGIQTQTFAMGENYENQLWFDFETQKTYTNQYGNWDIGVSCQDEPSIIICGGKNSYFSVCEIQGVSFNDVSPLHLNNAVWRFDHPNGNIDSSAFGNCFVKSIDGYNGKNSIFILDRGTDTLKNYRYIKIQLLGVKGGAYQFKWGYLSIPNLAYLTQIETKPDFNYVYYSFGKKDTVANEPVKSSNWDLVFTTYKETIDDANGVPYPYIIRGALTNHKNIEVCQIDNGISYNSCDKSFAEKQAFNVNANEIGYDWKEYNQQSSKYTILPTRFYIIKTSTNQYFKMKFVDFYDDQGRKGYPKMAWQLL